MASLFKKQDVSKAKSVLEIVRESVDVDASGNVRFRSRVGRGSGKAVEIPGSEFDDFVALMVEYRDKRDTLAAEEKAAKESESE